MDAEKLLKLFAPYQIVEREDCFDLSCRTFVVPAGNKVLVKFAEMLLIAAAQAELPPGKEHQLTAAHRQIEWAVRDRKVFGLPKELTVNSVDDLLGLDNWRVTIVPQVDKTGQETYIARFARKAILSENMTPAGLLRTILIKDRPVVRVLYATEWGELYETSKNVSRLLPIGTRELILVTEGEIPSQVPNTIQALIHRINGISALVVSARNFQEVLESQILYEARKVLDAQSMPVRMLTTGDTAGRIPTVLAPARMIVTTDGLQNLGSNSVVQEIAGFKETSLMYGATDLAGNWVELSQLYVACLRSGLPGVFDIDIRAHTLGSYWERILQPSVALVGGASSLPQPMYGLSGDEVSMAQLMRVVDLPHVDGAAHLVNASITDFYIALHQEFVNRLNQLMGTDVKLAVRTADQLFDEVGLTVTVGQAVELIRSVLNEDRVFGTRLDGKRFRLSDINADEYDWSVTRWMQVHNAWPGGTVTYLLMAGLAHHGPVIFNFKDSRLGNVSLMSQVELGVGLGNQARFAISGITRCYPKYATKSGGDNVDLLILFEMLERYPDRVEAMLRAMVNRWVFPLSPEQAGLVQIFKVVYAGGWSYDRYWESPNGTSP